MSSHKKVTRLPVQHPQAPHCPTCKAPLPNLNNISIALMGSSFDAEVISIIFRIRCKCGSEWDLTKGVKS